MVVVAAIADAGETVLVEHEVQASAVAVILLLLLGIKDCKHDDVDVDERHK